MSQSIYLDYNPIFERAYGLPESHIEIDAEFRDAPKHVKDALISVGSEDYDAASCAECGGTVGAWLDDSDDTRPCDAWTTVVLAVDGAAITRYCEGCADKRGLLPEDDAE